MKLKCLLGVVILLFCLLPASGLFVGDNCEVDFESGTCRLLEKCQNLVLEIRGAGTPMPTYLRRKLQKLSCGFEADQPLVCCSAPLTNIDNLNKGTINSYQQFPQTTDNPWEDENINNRRPITHTNPDTAADNNRGLNTNLIEQPPDITGHPNLRLLPTECGIYDEERIYGGNRTRLFQMPWMVLIAYNSARGIKLSCGGTLISEWYVLTAAHCVSFLGGSLSLAGVILGEHDVRKDPDCEREEGELYCAPKVRNVSISTIIPHPGYTPDGLFDDIALVRLSERADFSLDSIKPICLPTTRALQVEPLEGLKGVVAGWGATEDGLQSPVLLSVNLPIITNDECQKVYNGSPHIYNKQLCAGGEPNKDSCGGDSGGPLVYPGQTGAIGVRYVQRGIVSYGSKRCGIGGYPGVYTRVAYYMDWILDNLRP